MMFTNPIIVCRLFILAQVAVLCSSLASQSSENSSRRGFLQRSVFSVLTTAGATFANGGSGIQEAKAMPENALVFKPLAKWNEANSVYMSYDEFKTLLQNNQLKQVEFGSTGRSLVCVDISGRSHQIRDLPDDPPLLKELYAQQIPVTLQQFKFEKKMNAVSWLQELAGVGDDMLTDEEKYEYRGYKTYRQNLPERAYVPANLITGYDLSRNMKK